MAELTPGHVPTDTLPPPPAPPAPPKDERPKTSKRPTTRAGRREAAAQAAAKRGDKAPKSKTTSTSRQSQLKTRIGDQLTSVGMMLAAAGAATGKQALAADGMSVIQHSPTLAEALDQLAKQDPRVRETLERVLTVSTWGAVVSAVLPLTAAILGNHGVIPAELAGLLAPKTEPADGPDMSGLAGMMPGAAPAA